MKHGDLDPATVADRALEREMALVDSAVEMVAAGHAAADAARQPRLRRRAPRSRPAVGRAAAGAGDAPLGRRRGRAGAGLRAVDAGRCAGDGGRGSPWLTAASSSSRTTSRCGRWSPATSAPEAGRSRGPLRGGGRPALASGPRPSLVLLDINLPGDTGWDLLRGACRWRRRRARRWSSSTATSVGPERLREFGVAGYLPKPFALETLLEVASDSPPDQPRSGNSSADVDRGDDT